MQAGKRVHCSPDFFLALTILAVLGFAFTLFCGTYNIYAPLWGNIALSALPAVLLFFLWRLSRRGRWNDGVALAVTLALFAAFILLGLLNLLWMGLSAMDQPQAGRPRTEAGDRRLLRSLSGDLRVDVTGGRIAFYEDTHGGFHGDGRMLLTVAFDGDAGAGAAIAGSGAWNALPLPDVLTAAAYGRSELRRGVLYSTGPLAVDGDGACYFPAVENGYYFFRDRGAADSRSGSGFLYRGSYNFTLAIYDADSNTLYDYELDT